MKKGIIYIGLLVLFLGCNSESANDCFQTTGDIIQEEIQVADFSEIQIGEGVTLYIAQGDANKVVLETGSNLINDVETTVENGKLKIADHNTCNYVRDYAVTKVYVTAVNITKIINKSQFDVYSEGVLEFENLELVSEDYNTGGLAVGSFHLQLENEKLVVNFNLISDVYISGSTENLSVNFYSSNSRFEGTNFLATHVNIYQRSSNDILVYPIESINATIVSTGNVIAAHTPEEITVDAPYVGQLIFTD